MPTDPPDAVERLSDAEVELWADCVRRVTAATLATRDRRAAFLREALALRKRLENPATWEAAADAAWLATEKGMSEADCKAAEAAAIRRTVLGQEEA